MTTITFKLTAAAALVGTAFATPVVSPKINDAIDYFVVDAHQEAVRTTVLVETEDGGHGTGTIIADGFILTANHVTKNAKTITITYDDGSKATATVAWNEDKGNDVAMLRADTHGIKPAKMSCDAPKAATPVFSYGYPLYGKKVFSFGYIASEVELDPADSSAGSTILDMTLAPGNSGGGIWNDRGYLVGIADAVLIAPFGNSASLSGYSVEINSKTICDLMAKHK